MKGIKLIKTESENNIRLKFKLEIYCTKFFEKKEVYVIKKMFMLMCVAFFVQSGCDLKANNTASCVQNQSGQTSEAVVCWGGTGTVNPTAQKAPQVLGASEFQSGVVGRVSAVPYPSSFAAIRSNDDSVCYGSKGYCGVGTETIVPLNTNYNMLVDDPMSQVWLSGGNVTPGICSGMPCRSGGTLTSMSGAGFTNTDYSGEVSYDWGACWLMDSKLWCWGWDPFGAMGFGVYEERKDFADNDGAYHPWVENATPVNGYDWEVVRTDGLFASCGLTTSGRLYCWGVNRQGLVDPYSTNKGDPGLNQMEFFPTPHAVMSDKTFTQLTMRSNIACAKEEGTGDVWCWGKNSNDRFGCSTPLSGSNDWIYGVVNITPDLPTGYIGVTLTNTTLCLSMQNGTIRCQGRNSGGNLGQAIGSCSNVTTSCASLEISLPYADGWDFQAPPEGYGSLTCVEGLRVVNSELEANVWCWGSNGGYGENGGYGLGRDSNTTKCSEANNPSWDTPVAVF